MNPSPPDLFPQRPVRSEWGRTPSYRTRRIVTVMVCLLLLGGILYRAFSWTSSAPGQVPTIKAETGAWKQRPEQPGGIDIPHQDVQVYQELDAKDSVKPQVEHLLPPPESPQSAIPPAAPNTVPLNTQMENLAPPKIETTVTEAPAPTPAPAIAATVESQPAPQPIPASAPTAPVTPAPTAPAVQPNPAVSAAKPKPASVPQVLKAVSGNGAGHAVQLASVQDENSAQDMMQKLQTHYGSTLGDAHLRIVKADLGARGIYYRIRSQPLPEDQAKKICAALVRAKAGCILVH